MQANIDEPVINKLISFRYLFLLGGPVIDRTNFSTLYNVALSQTCIDLFAEYVEKLERQYLEDKKTYK